MSNIDVKIIKESSITAYENKAKDLIRKNYYVEGFQTAVQGMAILYVGQFVKKE